MAGMDWNAEADQKLLLFILHSNPSTVLNYTAAAAMLSQGGSHCTEEALRHHIRKLKRTIKTDETLKTLTDAASKGELEAPKGTPRSGRNKKAPGSVRADGKESFESPSKKRKMSQQTGVVKEEADLEDDCHNMLGAGTIDEVV